MSRHISFKLTTAEYRVFRDFADTVGAPHLNDLAKRCIAYAMTDARRRAEAINDKIKEDEERGQQHDTESGVDTADLGPGLQGSEDVTSDTLPDQAEHSTETV